MFAKVFGQIFDSSIADDYNCRRMFMDLLVLADPDGNVDMTHEAISRRTNVPLEEVQKYIDELCQPDPLSRSQLEEGKRLVPLDTRGWGWKIVNYLEYRKIRDQHARREYFREAQRKYRAKKSVKDKRVDSVDKGLPVLTSVDEGGQGLTSPSVSSSSVPVPSPVLKSRCTQQQAEDFCVSLGLPRSDGTAMFLHWEEKGWAKVKDWKLTIRKWKEFGYLPSQKKKKAQPAAFTAATEERDRKYQEAIERRQREREEEARKMDNGPL